MPARVFPASIPAVLLVLVLSGCAGVRPPGPALTGGERGHVLAAFRAAAAGQARCPAGITADFDGEIVLAGRRTPVSGLVAMQAPASVRITALDPLGRPALMAVLRDGAFTVVDVAAATVYTGRAGQGRMKKHLPRPALRGIFYTLAGLLPPGRLAVKGVYASGRAGLFFIDFALAGEDGFVHEVLFDVGNGKILSHALLDEDRDQVLVFEYSNREGCAAVRVRVRAKGFSAFFRLSGLRKLGDCGFSLSRPPMFREVPLS